MAMRMLIVAALAVGLNGAINLVAGAGLAPAVVAGGANQCDEYKTDKDCGDLPGKTCTLTYPTYGTVPEGKKANAYQTSMSHTPCSGTSNCRKTNMGVKKNDDNCTQP